MMYCLVAVCLLAQVSADIYLQSPCGSNNRLDDENRDRNNDNRLMDTQNNNRGGCNVGNLAVIAGSKLKLEWSAQHGSNNEKVGHTQIVLQYMCSDGLRDGTTTRTIPDNPINCYNNDCDTDVRFGRHENFDYYMHCIKRERNMGLFTASQKLKGMSAKYTRQNPNGGRFAYECPEERDYYPYWQPTPWIDIAVLVDDLSMCDMYKRESQNVKPRYHCKISGYDLTRRNAKTGSNYLIPINNQTICESISFQEEKPDGTGTRLVTGQWREDPAWGQLPTLPSTWAKIQAPDCKMLSWTRENHHGNPDGSGFFASYDWTVPETPHDQCVLRIRYNMSSNDYPLNTDAQFNKVDISTYPVHADYALNKTCGYLLKNNPKVQPFCDDSVTDKTLLEEKLEFQLAINTAQIGRTFEDRSHRFEILPAAEGQVEDKCATITNLLVSGKRGNIVQVYPATEYRFVPDKLTLGKDDCVHPMWFGSNTNPNNNAGQGRQGSDRSNIVGMSNRHLWVRGPGAPVMDLDVIYDNSERGRFSESYPASVKTTTFLGWSEDVTNHLALNVNSEQLHASGELSELDDSATNFRLPYPKKCGIAAQNLPTVTNYLSTRNNNFSNRSQKGRITCVMSAMQGGMVVGQEEFMDGNFKLVASSSGSKMESLAFEVTDAPAETGSASKMLSIVEGTSKLSVTIPIDVAPGGLESTTVYHQSSPTAEWEEVEAACSDTECTVDNVKQGNYIVKNEVMGGYVFLIVFLVLVVVGGAGFLYWKKSKD